MKINPNQFSSISSMLERRLNLQEIGVKNPQPQAPASSSSIFKLRRAGEGSYYIEDLSGLKLSIPDGLYLFAITTDEPTTVYCGAPFGSADANRNSGIQGHTSITKRAAVYFAGELHFRHGSLIRWTNGSGHYLPAASLRSSNLLPPVRLMLPENLFIDSFGPQTSDHRLLLEARGYDFP